MAIWCKQNNFCSKMALGAEIIGSIQDGAAMFGRCPGRSAKTMLLFTFLLAFDFSFYTHNVGTDHLRQRYTLGHWKPLH